MVLTRGLSVEQQKSNRDSLQYSSGYSTETTTPSCSEDTIPSQGQALISCSPPLRGFGLSSTVKYPLATALHNVKSHTKAKLQKSGVVVFLLHALQNSIRLPLFEQLAKSSELSFHLQLVVVDSSIKNI